jgi:hypothetical protein
MHPVDIDQNHVDNLIKNQNYDELIAYNKCYFPSDEDAEYYICKKLYYKGTDAAKNCAKKIFNLKWITVNNILDQGDIPLFKWLIDLNVLNHNDLLTIFFKLIDFNHPNEAIEFHNKFNINLNKVSNILGQVFLSYKVKIAIWLLQLPNMRFTDLEVNGHNRKMLPIFQNSEIRHLIFEQNYNLTNWYLIKKFKKHKNKRIKHINRLLDYHIIKDLRNIIYDYLYQ